MELALSLSNEHILLLLEYYGLTIFHYAMHSSICFSSFFLFLSLFRLFNCFFLVRSLSIVQSVGHLITPSVWSKTKKKLEQNWIFFSTLDINLVKLRGKKIYFRAIVTAWVVIVTTAIPVAIVHGVVNFPYNGRNYTACLFLVENGYNLVLFQVNIPVFFFSFLFFFLFIHILKATT